jgi:PAS domain S-box-containing protein
MASELADPARLALLRSLDLLRPHEDASFDRVTAIAALATGRPTALITFLAPEGEWIASKVGWDRLFHPLSESFCIHALGSDQLLQVPDASRDPRFQANPLVTGESAVRSYAGQPLVFDGHMLGAVCVADRQPGELTPEQAAVLKHLTDLVADLLRVRLERSHAEQARARAAALMDALERSEATLRESEERYRLLWQTTTDAVLIIDDTGIIRFANPALETLFGRRPEDVIGQPLAVVQPERLREAHVRGFSGYLRSGQRRLDWRATETVGLKADGTELPIEVAFSELEVGGRRHFAAFMRDLSERHRAQLALRNSEAQFRSLTALSSDWYWEIDEDLRYTFISDGAQRSGMLDPQRMLGKRPWDTQGDASHADWQGQKARLLRHEAFRDFEMVQQGPDGATQVLRISGEPVFDDTGRFTGYRGVGRNITEERRAESARRELEDHLQETQKLEAIGALAGGIAHDFNNIVAGILGNTQLALDDLDAAHPAVQSLQQIRKAGLRAREMVQQILTFARRRPRRPAQCELHDLVDETMGLLRATVPTSVKIEAVLPHQPLRVFADATQVEQALINLCANAWQAMAGRPGRIEIAAEEVALDRDAADRIGRLAQGRYVHLRVSDDGPGMDEATVKRVFEPFFTTKPEGEGTGLGLSVVHGIVTGHGGAVTVDSAVGSGATFHLWLPADEAAVVTEPAALDERPPDGAGRHVMYVDDDEVMTLMVSRLLERSGYRATAFGHAADAIRHFKSAPWDVDVVVTDLNMPGLSGLDVLREISAVRPGLPVIIGSGNLPPEFLVDAEHAGVRATFHKQNILEELPALLAEVLGL